MRDRAEGTLVPSGCGWCDRTPLVLVRATCPLNPPARIVILRILGKMQSVASPIESLLGVSPGRDVCRHGEDAQLGARRLNFSPNLVVQTSCRTRYMHDASLATGSHWLSGQKHRGMVGIIDLIVAMFRTGLLSAS